MERGRLRARERGKGREKVERSGFRACCLPGPPTFRTKTVVLPDRLHGLVSSLGLKVG